MKESDSPKEKPEKETGSQPSEAAAEDAEQIRQQMLRIAADYQYYQKRTQRLIEQAGQLAEEKLMKELLPVLDNFEHALAKGGQAAEGDALLQGIRIIYDQLLAVLRRYGLERIVVQEGEGFDPSLHEAMLHEVNEQYPEHSVVRELASGYRMNERTLRPAKVSVSKKPATAPAPEEAESQQEKEEQDE